MFQRVLIKKKVYWIGGRKGENSPALENVHAQHVDDDTGYRTPDKRFRVFNVTNEKKSPFDSMFRGAQITTIFPSYPKPSHKFPEVSLKRTFNMPSSSAWNDNAVNCLHPCESKHTLYLPHGNTFDRKAQRTIIWTTVNCRGNNNSVAVEDAAAHR